MKGETMAKRAKLRITPSSENLGGGSRLAGARVEEIAASRPACPLCGALAADTRLALGALSLEVCSNCSQGAWHAMGLFDWAKKLFGGVK